MITKTDTCILENKNEWVEYVAIHAPITFDEAQSLYAISMVANITKESIVKRLCECGDECYLRRIIALGIY